MGTVALAVTADNQAIADVRNAALAFGVLVRLPGRMPGRGRGPGETVADGDRRGRPAGLAAGRGPGAGVSLATLGAFAKCSSRYSEYDIFLSTAMHGLIWGLCGAEAGLAFAVGLGGGRRWLALAPAAALVGAVLGAIAFELAGAGLFPLASTGEPVSTTWASRLTARLLVALATAAAVILILPAAHPVGEPRRGPG